MGKSPKRAVQNTGSSRAGKNNRSPNRSESAPDKQVFADGRSSKKRRETQLDAPAGNTRKSSRDKLFAVVSRVRGEEVTPEQIPQYVKPVTNVVRELIKDEDGSLKDDDKKTLDGIDKFAEMAPKIVGMVQGFMQAMNANAQASAPQQRAIAGPRPPPGWLESDAMTRWNRKYFNGQISDWYAQGEAYEEFVRSGRAVNPSVMAQMQMPAPPPVARPIAPPPQPPPQVYEEQPMQQQPSEETVNSVEQTMIAQNKQYLQMAGNYLENMKQEDFNATIENPSGLIEKIKPFMPMVPFNVTAMIKANEPITLATALREHCPNKWASVIEGGKEEKVIALITQIKQAIQT